MPLPRPFRTAEPTRRATAPEALLASQSHTPNGGRVPLETLQRPLQDGEVQAYRHLAQSIVDRTLAHEHEYRRTQRPDVESRDWKLLKRQHDLCLYKQSEPKHVQDGRQTTSRAHGPLILCVGSLAGDLEDVLYGIHAKTRHEMQLLLPCLTKRHVDCALLAILEGGSSSDPFRQLSLKWHRADAYAETKVVKPREWFTLESMGVRTDAHGQPYGYYMLQSIDVAAWPVPPEPSSVLRAHLMVCCIYRQAPTSWPSVKVYSKGRFDLKGDLPSFLVDTTSCAFMLAVLSAMDCAKTKRLTLLALRFRHTRDDVSSLPNHEEATGREQAHMVETADPLKTLPTRLRSKPHRQARSQRQAAAEPCCVCTKKPAMASLMGATHRTCGVCLRGVCNKCHVKRRLFARSHSVLVACCKSCLLEANDLKVDPQAPCPMLS